MTHKTYIRFLSLSLLSFFAGLTISGCSSSTTPGTTPPPSTVSPKTGSSFTYTMYNTDSSGTKIGNDTTVNATVISDSMQFLGQSNVYTVIDNSDTAKYSYASNGDWMVYYQSTGITGIFQPIGDAVFHRWITLGTTSKTSASVVTNLPDTIAYSGFNIPALINVTTAFVADETITVGAETLTAHHCRITATATSNSALISPNVTYTDLRDIYFVSKLGYTAKATTHQSLPAIALLGRVASGSGTVKVLTVYTLK